MNKDLEEELITLKREVQELSQSIKELREQSSKEAMPTGIHRKMLQILAEEGRPLTVREISDLAERAETTVSGYLRSLHKSGYLQRKPRLVGVGDTRRVRKWEYYLPEDKRRKWQFL